MVKIRSEIIGISRSDFFTVFGIKPDYSIPRVRALVSDALSSMYFSINDCKEQLNDLSLRNFKTEEEYKWASNGITHLLEVREAFFKKALEVAEDWNFEVPKKFWELVKKEN